MSTPEPAVGSRRAARERALGLLYEAETKGLGVEELMDELPMEPDAYASRLLLGVAKHQTQIDDLLRRFAKGWTLERMAALDRAVLRLATFELLEVHDVPLPVIIDEAVDLAKTYSTDGSGSFVNGMLSAIGAEARAIKK